MHARVIICNFCGFRPPDSHLRVSHYTLSIVTYQSRLDYLAPLAAASPPDVRQGSALPVELLKDLGLCPRSDFD